MKLLGNLLLTISLVAAMLSASTAYITFLDGPRESFATESGEPLRMKAAAGVDTPGAEDLAELERRVTAGEMTAEAYVAARRARTERLGAAEDEGGTRLTPDRVELLRDVEVESVFLKSFAWGRWRHRWVFVLSALGLLVGSLMVRSSERAEVEAGAAGDRSRGGSPEEALQAIVRVPEDLREELETLGSDAERLERIQQRIDAMQREHLDRFLDGRPQLVARLGLAGYAELMDRFAAGERQLNRAWSSASDGVLVESAACLVEASRCLREAHERLAQG